MFEQERVEATTLAKISTLDPSIMSPPSQSQTIPQFYSVDVAGSGDRSIHLVWGHGWGQSGAAFRALAEALAPVAPSTLIDFPGFGASPLPPMTWSTADYADAVAEWMRERFGDQPVVWLGHSFGGRVGLQLAARHPKLVRAMVLVAAAGLQRRRSFAQRTKLALQRAFFKTARSLLREGTTVERLRQRMGSADYRNAGAMRPIFSRVVAEDLTKIAARVRVPTLLIYGREDTETPVEMGERLRALIPGAELVVLEHYGHLNILDEGRHQLALRIRRFLEPYLSR